MAYKMKMKKKPANKKLAAQYGDKTKITVTKEIDGEVYKKVYKGYTISNIPEECNHWFNYKGLTYVIN